jgi:hypothetical protein
VSEWENRQLCPDGGCIGVIGPDGTCKVCGRAAPNWGDERRRGTLPVEDDDEAASGSDESPDAVAEVRPGAQPSGDPDWAVCPDGACTGVIEVSGRCSVCGRQASEIEAT